MTGVRVVLASASPARLKLLQAAGLRPEVVVSDVDEDALLPRFASVTDVARGLAAAKAEDVAARLAHGPGRTLVIGCDSVLEIPGVPELAGRALGKPVDAADAVRRWQLMSGGEGLLHTGHCLVDGSRRWTEVASTLVRFAELDRAEIEAYVASGEPLAVAGAFTIDGLGGAFVRGIEGDWSNVVGLSLPLLRDLMAGAGVPWPSLWQGP